MSECDVVEEIDYDSLSVDELFAQGKLLFKEHKYAESAEYFSRALERKSRDNPTDASLREYYLWFADSLLTKEEQTSTIFSDAVNEATSGDNLPTAESVLNAANNDESLAFELFSIGHECYTNYLNELDDVPEKEVLDASYCLTRLGDMYFTNNQFNEAAKEYGKALELREKYKLDLKYLAPLHISLAQSQMFSGQLNVSLTTFNKCKEVLESILSRKDLEGDKLNDMKNTLEDIIIQIGDLKKIMEKVATSSNGTNIKGSQCNAGDYVPKTTGTLDEKQLDPSVKSKVIDIGAGTMDGPGFDYDSTFTIFPVLLPSSRIATNIYIRTIRRLESNAICSEMINDLLRRVRISDKISWSNNKLSKYSTCSSIIARGKEWVALSSFITSETGRIYRRDDITFDQWQYMILRKKFKRLLMEHGDCPKFLCTQLIAEMMNIIKNDVILRNLLILSNDRFVEAIMSRLIEQALNEKVYSLELNHSCENVNKFGIIKKHLLRAVGASAIAQTAAKLWGWKGSSDKLLMPPPIAPPSKLSAENYCLYLCGNDKNAKKMFKMTSSIPVNFKDGSIPLPKVFFPFSAGNDDEEDDDISIQAEELVTCAIEKEINKDAYHNAEPPFDDIEVKTPTNIKSHGETVWDVVQRRHRSRSESDKPKGSPHTTQNNQSREVECDGNDMQNLIREHYHISEHVLSSHTQPFANAYKKPKAVKWSAADTQRFYTAIETFGTDFMLVRAHLPEFTDRQIYDKFKLEERKNPQLIQNALSANRTISLNQYEKQHGKIDVSTHYNPDNDPYLTEDATPKKISLTLKEESITPSVNAQETQSPEPDVDNKIINLFV